MQTKKFWVRPETQDVHTLWCMTHCCGLTDIGTICHKHTRPTNNLTTKKTRTQFIPKCEGHELHFLQNTLWIIFPHCCNYADGVGRQIVTALRIYIWVFICIFSIQTKTHIYCLTECIATVQDCITCIVYSCKFLCNVITCHGASSTFQYWVIPV